ncbi:hypothetical protein NDU88_003577 [Pleurodeles waltl]|uniref:Uncharacterized protein n=1 Tax=Pleurodeles waltl TaxID=8319 RepID=A0AAV7M3R7_PLEWA|nr:hypothetical protein NDU88_003577 [Pleurodeles waltl]
MYPSGISTVEEKLDVVLEAIKQSWVSIKDKTGTVAMDLTLLRNDHRKLIDRACTTEQTVTELQLQMQEKKT